MLTAVVLALLIGSAQEQSPVASPRLEAERLARDGQTHEALERYERIVSVDPADVEARIWIARLLQRLGHTYLAEKEYRQALAQAPNHVDALVGLAVALNSRGATREASAFLDRAEQLAPESADVLAARGQSSKLSGHSTEAERYYARAHTLSPNDKDIEQSFDQTRRINRNRVEGLFQYEMLTRATGAHTADVAVDLRADDRFRYNGRLQVQTRASRSEARAGGGVEWRARPDLTVRGTVLVGPGAEIIARTDVLAEIEHSRGRIDYAGGARSVSFAGADVWILSPQLTLWLNDRTALSGRYFASWTSFDDRPATLTHSGMGRLRYNIWPRLSLDIAYSRGYESIDTLTVERLDSLRADTVSSGVVYHFRGIQSLAASVDIQRRSDDRTMIRFTAGVVHRF